MADCTDKDSANQPGTVQNNNDRIAEEQADDLLALMYKWINNSPAPTGLAVYEPEASDVIIATFPKAGTTLLQNLVYHLLYATEIAPGSPVHPRDTFSDISVAAPWLEFHPQHGVALPATRPRVMKTHAPVEAHAAFLEHATRAPRYIALLRSPLELPASWLDFAFDDTAEHDAASLEHPADPRDPAVRDAAFHRYVQSTVLPDGDLSNAGLGDWAGHMRGWAAPRRNVLLLFYDDVVADVPGCVRAVARFLRIDATLVTDAIVEQTSAACDRAAMAADPRFRCGVEAEAFGIARLWKAKESGRKDSFKTFDFSEKERQKMAARMLEVFGFDNYEDAKSSIKATQNRMLGENESAIPSKI